jgi:hypothetical protein
MNKKLIIILLSIFIILVSVDFGVKYYESLTDNVNISITPDDNNITQGHNLTVYVNATASLPFRSFIINAATYTAGAEIQYLGPNGTTPEALHGLIQFNITGNDHIRASWNETVLQNSGYRYPCYTLAPAGYYKIDNIGYTLPLSDYQINPIITYNDPEIHLAGVYCNYYNKSITNDEYINISLINSVGSNIPLNGSAYINSCNSTTSWYANITSSNGHFSIKLENVQYLMKTDYGVTKIMITIEYGKLFIVLPFGGKIE